MRGLMAVASSVVLLGVITPVPGVYAAQLGCLMCSEVKRAES